MFGISANLSDPRVRYGSDAEVRCARLNARSWDQSRRDLLKSGRSGLVSAGFRTATLPHAVIAGVMNIRAMRIMMERAAVCAAFHLELVRAGLRKSVADCIIDRHARKMCSNVGISAEAPMIMPK